MYKNNYFWLFLGFFFLLGSCSQNQTAQSQAPENEAEHGDFPKFRFDKVEHDFGKMTPGTVVKETFYFQNVGDVPLIITNARASCGCTLPEYPKNTPIAPAEKGEITVEFNSTGKIGQQNKTVTLFSNVKGGKTELKIYASVEYNNDQTPTPRND